MKQTWGKLMPRPNCSENMPWHVCNRWDENNDVLLHSLIGTYEEDQMNLSTLNCYWAKVTRAFLFSTVPSNLSPSRFLSTDLGKSNVDWSKTLPAPDRVIGEAEMTLAFGLSSIFCQMRFAALA